MAKEIDIVTAAIASAMAGSGGGAVQSVNGQTGAVVLNAEDVGALPDDTDIPTALADLAEDAEHRTVTDTQTAQWDAKQDAIPDETYDDYGSAAEVQTNLDTVTAKIPSTASASNQLTDKSYVDSALAEKQDIIPANTYDTYGAADAAEAAANDYTDDEIADVQSQIDALVSKSDVVDVVGTYAELQNYDTTTLLNNDVVKVLSDSTHSDGRSYYRWIITDDVGTWSYIGSEAVGYTKSETDTLLNAKQNTISDLATIRSGAALGATAVQPETGKGLSSNDYTTAEKNKLAGIAAGATAVSESTVSGWGFTKNTGTYSKPSSGIPKTDLASAVQTSLDKADAAASKPLYFSDSVVAVADWVADTTYTNYLYKADIVCTGVTSDMYALVTFDAADAESGNFSTVCNSDADIVTIYAKAAPTDAVTVPAIIAMEVDAQ